MAKISEYQRAYTFDENDVLIKDGSGGTKIIQIEDVTSYLNTELGDPESNIPMLLQGTFKDYNTSLWESGQIAVATGSALANSKRLRTSFLSKSIVKAEGTSNLVIAAYVWDKNGYAGGWTGSGLTKATGSTISVRELNLSAIASFLPQENAPYSFKLVAKNAGEEQVLVVSDAESILFTYITDSTLSHDGIAADAKAVGDFNKPVQNILTDGDVLNRELFGNYNANGVTVTWNEDKTECTVNGNYTGDDSIYDFLMRAEDFFPSLCPGQRYFVKCKSTNPSYVFATLALYNSNNAYCGQFRFTQHGIIEIPRTMVYNGVTRTVAYGRLAIRIVRGNNSDNDVVSDIAMKRVFDSNYFGPEDMVASSNIQNNKFFMLGDMLFLSTTAISTGDSIIPGTNCIQLTLDQALNLIYNT